MGDIFIDSESPVLESDSFQVWLKTDFESAYCLFSTCSLEGTKEFFYIMPNRRVINFSSLSTQILGTYNEHRRGKKLYKIFI